MTQKKFSANRKVHLISSVIIALVVIAVLSFFSYAFFGVFNPIASAVGLVRVIVFKTPYVEVQSFPNRVVFFAPNSNVIEAMSELGYTHIEEKQMGRTMFFEKDGTEYRGAMDFGRLSFWRGY